MSTATFIIGESGTGKSTSLRNLPPNDTLLIQAVRKPLPFRSKGWEYFTSKEATPNGNIFVSDNSEDIVKLMQKTRRKRIVIDDFQYILANEFMRRSNEKGYEKFTEIGRHAWDILTAAGNLAPDVRAYILGHSQSDEFGRTKVKTIGRMLDEKITVEGMFTIVLKTVVQNGEHYFATRNSGSDTVKSPMGMFADELIPNDLAAVDDAIADYYSIAKAA